MNAGSFAVSAVNFESRNSVAQLGFLACYPTSSTLTADASF